MSKDPSSVELRVSALEADLHFARVDIKRLNVRLQECAQAEEDREGRIEELEAENEKLRKRLVAADGIKKERERPADWPHCEHYDLGPADEEGVQVCNDCHAAVKQRIGGQPVDEFYRGQSTFVSQEGDDVPFLWPGEG